jgi:hypothetical protein
MGFVNVTHSTINGTGSEAGNATGLTFILLMLFSGFSLPVLNRAAICGIYGTVYTVVTW